MARMALRMALTQEEFVKLKNLRKRWSQFNKNDISFENTPEFRTIVEDIEFLEQTIESLQETVYSELKQDLEKDYDSGFQDGYQEALDNLEAKKHE